MITGLIRSLCLAGGLSGAAVLSQYPAFTQAYTQRLAGQVDALTEVVADFDRSALAAGLTRTEALAELRGTAFLAARNDDMIRTFARHATLSDSLARLRRASPMQQLVMPHRLADSETLRQTLSDYAPALPLTAAGAVAAGAGFVVGWGGLAFVLAALGGAFRRWRQRRRFAPVARRIDPPVQEQAAAPQSAPLVKGQTRP